MKSIKKYINIDIGKSIAISIKKFLKLILNIYHIKNIGFCNAILISLGILVYNLIN